MSVISGKAGAVDGHESVGRWSITEKADNASYASSNTSGGIARLQGNVDWSGNFTAYTTAPAYFPGEEITFTGSIDGTNGATGDAIVDSVTITCEMEGNKPITCECAFSANGVLTLGTAAASDTSETIATSSRGCKVLLNGSEVSEARKWTLTITADNKSYVSAATNGQTKRVGGNVDAKASIDVYTDNFSSLPTPGTEIADAKLFIGPTSASTGCWHLGFTRVGDISNLLVDPETRVPVGATINLEMSALSAGSDTGFIKAPGGSTVWPAT